MNVEVTTFTNPFSFFCKIVDDHEEFSFMENKKIDYDQRSEKSKLSDVKHGQYVAVLWNGKWTRGVVSMETQFLIWLIDYGIYFRPDDKTIYLDLPTELKKYPTKVFEASIHGVIPMDKVVTDDCEIKNEISTTWNMGSVSAANSLISNATRIQFMPIALLSTKNNDIVLGDLYLTILNKGVVNIADEMKLWPVFLEQNEEHYIKNLETYYTSRKRHRACLLKPEFPDLELPKLTVSSTLSEYSAICANAPPFIPDSVSEDGSTVIDIGGKDKQEKRAFKLTAEEMEICCNTYIEQHGRLYNQFHTLVNKARDFNMCVRYQDHDLKSAGRANKHSSLRRFK